MKKQSSFALFLLVVAAISIAVLVIGIFGLQRLYSLTKMAKDDVKKQKQEYAQLDKDLSNKEKWTKLLNDYDVTLASLDTDMVDYKYIPTYLEQIQRTATQTGNMICSIRPRPIASLDANNPLIKASNDLWLKEYREIADAAKYSTGNGSAAAQNNFRIQQFSLEIQGSYPSILQFLNALRTFPKLVYVHSVSVVPLNQLKADDLKATIETYAIITPEQYQPEKAPTADKADAEGKTR